jgi:hypothetical protein
MEGRNMNRRTLLKVSAASMAALALPTATRTLAQATPEAGDLPELSITVRDDGFDIPDGLTAGRYAVSVINAGMAPAHASLGLLPVGIDLAMVEDAMASESEAVPQWMLDTKWVGLPDWGFPGETRTGIVDLPPGMYLGFSPFEGWFNIIEIPGETISVPDPAATVSVELVEMAFTWGQDALPSGPQLLQITNAGATLHDIQFLSVPEGATTDHAMEMFMLEETGGTPSPDNLLANLNDEWAPVAACSILAPGVTTWIDIDLAPGSYLVMCPLPFPSGPPHAFLGMMEVITVA